MTNVTLIGDSIRLHYQSDVARALADDAVRISGPTVNCGSSRHIRQNLNVWIPSDAPEIVHLNCGLHDLRRDPATGAPQVTLEEYAANVDAIVCRLSERGIRVIWANSTPIDEKRHNAARFGRRYASDVVAYNAVAESIAHHRGLPVNDLFSAVESAGPSQLLGDDGVHFTESGYRFLADRVAEFIKPRAGAASRVP